jgi:hypothetical protein
MPTTDSNVSSMRFFLPLPVQNGSLPCPLTMNSTSAIAFFARSLSSLAVIHAA